GRDRRADGLRVHLGGVLDRSRLRPASTDVRVACDQERSQRADEREDRVLLLLGDLRAERDRDRDDVADDRDELGGRDVGAEAADELRVEGRGGGGRRLTTL